jgi:hypothetical protein
MRLSTLLLIFLLGACNTAPGNKVVSRQYFDLKGYVSAAAQRLNQLNPQVDKTVTINQSAEHKKLKVTDWQKELSVITDADINKSAWQGLFRVSRKQNSISYISDNEKVPVKSLTVSYKDGKPVGIDILMETTNLLYTSRDILTFYPDSIYQVRKTQKIKLLNKKEYQVELSWPRR